MLFLSWVGPWCLWLSLCNLTSSGACDPLCSVDETSSQEYEANTDLLKALAIFGATVTGTVAINHSWVAANQDLAMALLVGIGYVGIIFEESLLVGYSELWSLLNRLAVAELMHTSTEVSEIVFFLLGAMTIIEIVDAHQGFKLVTNNITTRKPHTLIWV
ncbi:hypothetical protein Hdeb2414_s0019g00547841 [Helianthus debilis subsp. tardiflorus]